LAKGRREEDVLRQKGHRDRRFRAVLEQDFLTEPAAVLARAARVGAQTFVLDAVGSSLCATMRLSKSATPPGAYGTMMRIGLDFTGYVCAAANDVVQIAPATSTDSNTRPMSARFCFIRLSMLSREWRMRPIVWIVGPQINVRVSTLGAQPHVDAAIPWRTPAER
jgi:hypothetical protein